MKEMACAIRPYPLLNIAIAPPLAATQTQKKVNKCQQVVRMKVKFCEVVSCRNH